MTGRRRRRARSSRVMHRERVRLSGPCSAGAWRRPVRCVSCPAPLCVLTTTMDPNPGHTDGPRLRVPQVRGRSVARTSCAPVGIRTPNILIRRRNQKVWDAIWPELSRRRKAVFPQVRRCFVRRSRHVASLPTGTFLSIFETIFGPTASGNRTLHAAVRSTHSGRDARGLGLSQPKHSSCSGGEYQASRRAARTSTDSDDDRQRHVRQRFLPGSTIEPARKPGPDTPDRGRVRRGCGSVCRPHRRSRRCPSVRLQPTRR